MGRPPERNRRVFVLGAGLSCAFRLPNTQQLIDEALADSPATAAESLRTRLTSAEAVLYPDSDAPGFKPDVVDFFSSFRLFRTLGSRLPETGVEEPDVTYRTLANAITRMLVARMKSADERGALAGHTLLDEITQPGNIVITTNWDTLVEWSAMKRHVPIRFAAQGTGSFSSAELTVLKLHGSIDWCQKGATKRPDTKAHYGPLGELLNGRRTRRMVPPAAEGSIRRVRWDSSGTWQHLRGSYREPYIVTMATGKDDELGPLQQVWVDAYHALSRASRIEIRVAIAWPIPWAAPVTNATLPSIAIPRQRRGRSRAVRPRGGRTTGHQDAGRSARTPRHHHRRRRDQQGRSRSCGGPHRRRARMSERGCGPAHS